MCFILIYFTKSLGKSVRSHCSHHTDRTTFIGIGTNIDVQYKKAFNVPKLFITCQIQ